MNNSYDKSTLLILILCFCFTALTHAQTGLTGNVHDAETGETLPGATILLLDTDMGASAGADGDYEITGVQPGTYTVVVSFVGYAQLETEINIPANTMVEQDFYLETEGVSLDEIVVSGYSTRQRAQPTGSIASVRGEEIRTSIIQTPDQALQGRTSGVMVSAASGQPGGELQVRIRGTGSITAGNEPLYIVDGVQLGRGDGNFASSQASSNVLNSLNPADIESIEVLKDASASAIYGAQAANGVVLITTRRGQAGQTIFNVSTQYGFVDQPIRYDIMEGPTWVEFMGEAAANRAIDLGQDPEAARQNIYSSLGNPNEVSDYDWQDAVLHTGNIRRANISASGGGDETRFFVSGSYDYQDGQIRNSDYRRLQFRTNLDHRVSDQFLISSRLNLSNTLQHGLAADGNFINSVFHGAVNQRPTDPIFLEDGSYNQDLIIGYNQRQMIELEQREARTNQIVGSLSGVYNIRPNLSFRSFWGLDYRIVRDSNFRPPEIPGYASTGGSATESTREQGNFNTNQVLEFQDTFDESHALDAIAGVEYRHEEREYYTALGQQFISGQFQTLQLAATPASVNGATTEFKLASAFSRAEYSYEDTYFFTGSLRYDGSSRFGSENQYGLFYSVALGWEMANESFLENVDFLNQLKLRASYGTTGNTDINDFAPRSLFGSGGAYAGAPGLRPTQLGNPFLTWEEARGIDVGLDFAFFSDRFYGSVDVYRVDNESLLLDAFLPTDSGFDSYSENVGTVRNQGIELELGGVLVNTTDFLWNLDLNVAFQKNEITRLADGQENIGNELRVGHPIDIYWGPEYAGVNTADGRAMWYDADGNITYQPTSSDYVDLGNPMADIAGGLNTSFNFRNFSLNGFFQYEFGKDTYDITIGSFLTDPSRGRALLTDNLRRWQQPGDVTDIPRAYTQDAFPGSGGNRQLSSRNVNDVSYLRLKEVSLSYQIPGGLAEALQINNARVFVQGRNLITWTGYEGLDPEMVEEAQGYYPVSRQFTIGLDFQF